MCPSIAAKRAKASQKRNPHWRVLKGPLPAPPKMMVLLEVKGRVWTFQHPRSRVLYRCELDAACNERWFSNFPKWLERSHESEWISQSDAARLIGVSRQAIRNAIVWKRLGTVACNGRPMVSRSEVLALPIDLKRRRAAKL
jgi:hypothetical protein